MRSTENESSENDRGISSRARPGPDDDGGQPLDGLTAIAETAPAHTDALVPVHADCHWGNWLARDGELTALLDFEWARFGEPMDDWFFLIADSGVHTPAVLRTVIIDRVWRS